MAKSNKIIIDQFMNMRPDLPAYSANNSNYLMSGVNPLYYLDDNTKQEEVIAPLAASTAMTLTYVNTTGTISDIVSILDNVPYAIGDINGYITNGGASPATPFGTTSQVVSLSTFGNFLMASSTASQNVYYAGIHSSTFSAISPAPPITPTLGGFYMVPFLEFLTISSGQYVYTADLGSTPYLTSTVPNLNLGNGFIILGKPEVWTTYLSIPASKSYIEFTENYLFLWNGFGVTYQYNIPLPGKYIGQVNISGTLYVVVEERTGICTLGYIKSYQYIRLRTLHGTPTTVNGQATTSFTKIKPVINARGYVGITTDAGLYLYKDDPSLKEISFLHDNVNYSAVIASSPTPNANDAFSLYGVRGNSVYTTAGSTTNNPIAYDSQFIEATPSKLKIWYNTPPQQTTDAIYTTLYGIDEYDSQGNLFNETITLNAIMSTSFDNYKNTVLDCGGFTGDKMSIAISTVNNGTWKPVIKRIEIVPQSEQPN